MHFIRLFVCLIQVCMCTHVATVHVRVFYVRLCVYIMSECVDMYEMNILPTCVTSRVFCGCQIPALLLLE